MTKQTNSKQRRQAKVDELMTLHRRYVEVQSILWDTDTSACTSRDPRIAEECELQIELESIKSRIQLLDKELFPEEEL